MKNPEDKVRDELFGNSVGSLEGHIDRKRAIADETRYSIVYFLSMHGEMKKNNLADSMDISEEELEKVIDPLLNTNLVARVPSPDGNDNYRITRLGVDEISSDIEFYGKEN